MTFALNELAPAISSNGCVVSVVVPVYKAEATLRELCARLCNTLGKISPSFEVVLVEDCGEDRSWQIIKDLAAEDDRILGVQLSRNFGQHSAITAGLDRCRGEWVVVMDCDLQDRPEEIGRLFEKAQEGYEVVLARRANRRDSLLKRFVSRAFYAAFRYLTDTKYDGSVGNFRIMSRKVVCGYLQMREQLRFFGAQIQWLGFPTGMIDVTHAERTEGKSTYTFGKLMKLATDTIIAYSDKPLRLAVRLGFVMAAGAFAYGVGVLIRAALFGVPVPGWSSLIISLYFLGGIIITLLGTIGVYLGKTFDESKRRPLYVINHETAHDRASP